MIPLNLVLQHVWNNASYIFKMQPKLNVVVFNPSVKYEIYCHFFVSQKFPRTVLCTLTSLFFNIKGWEKASFCSAVLYQWIMGPLLLWEESCFSNSGNKPTAESASQLKMTSFILRNTLEIISNGVSLSLPR